MFGYIVKELRKEWAELEMNFNSLNLGNDYCPIEDKSPDSLNESMDGILEEASYNYDNNFFCDMHGFKSCCSCYSCVMRGLIFAHLYRLKYCIIVNISIFKL